MHNSIDDFETRVHELEIPLTESQFEVLELLQQGKTPKEIAQIFDVGADAIHHRIQSILLQLNYEPNRYWEIIPGAINPWGLQIESFNIDCARSYNLPETFLDLLISNDIDSAMSRYKAANGIYPLECLRDRYSPFYSWIYLLLNEGLNVKQIGQIMYAHEDRLALKVSEIKQFFLKHFVQNELKHPLITLNDLRPQSAFSSWVEGRLLDDIDQEVISLIYETEGEILYEEIAEILGFSGSSALRRVRKIAKLHNRTEEKENWFKSPTELNTTERFLVHEIFKHQFYQIKIPSVRYLNRNILNIKYITEKGDRLMKSICGKLGIEYISGNIPDFVELLEDEEIRKLVYPESYFPPHEILKLLNEETNVPIEEF